MKYISVREFNQNISKFLKEAPVKITSKGTVVATILPGDFEPKKGKAVSNEVS